jgi:hypothetical protein
MFIYIENAPVFIKGIATSTPCFFKVDGSSINSGTNKLERSGISMACNIDNYAIPIYAVPVIDVDRFSLLAFRENQELWPLGLVRWATPMAAARP